MFLKEENISKPSVSPQGKSEHSVLVYENLPAQSGYAKLNYLAAIWRD